MKNARKLTSILVLIAMLFMIAAPAMAANDGTITITNPVEGVTYNAYLMFELESYNGTAYSYKITDAWRNFVSNGYGKDVFNVDEQGYVKLKDGVSIDNNSTAAANLAKEAIKYAKDNNLTATTTLSSTNKSVGDLALGYYVVDSTLGTLCALTTTAATATITEKNEEPTNEKKVEEDKTSSYGPKNDADIGQVVNFQSKVTLPKGSENVVFHDNMSTGLDLDKTEGNIKVYTNEAMTTELDSKYYSVNTNPTTHDEGCTFEITFTKEYLDSLTADATDVYVKYSATVTAGAVVGGNGNPNTSYLKYGDANDTKTTPGSETKTYTWEFDILKYDSQDTTKAPLAGAKFVLLNSDASKVATFTNEGTNYKFAGWSDIPTAEAGQEIPWAANTILTTVKDSQLAIKGLDADTYKLREVEAPAGYNKLTEDTTVTITTQEGTDGKTLTQEVPTAEVGNSTGTVLPSTGGIGTTIFYVVGAALVVGAGVLLVTKKRMTGQR